MGVAELGIDELAYVVAGVAEDVGVAPGAGKDEAAFEGRHDRGCQSRRFCCGEACSLEALAERFDPAREHPIGGASETVVGVGDLASNGPDRAHVDVVALFECLGRTVEEVADRRPRVGCGGGDQFEELQIPCIPSV